MSIRIILADDHTILRHGLSKSFQQEDDFKVIGQAKDGRSTVELARELLPDVVVMDIAMPDLNGVEATRQINMECPDVSVVGLSMHSSNKYVREMFRAGAKGYLLKDCPFEELAQAVRTVVDGKTYVSPSVSQAVIEDYVSKPADRKSAFNVLSQREREVLQLLAEGKSTKQVARRLHISPKTVEAHRLRVMHKLEIDNLALLTKYALQEGLTPHEL
ncbi:MAG: DNA-binding response regulator [Planctomycetes bacterium B3_Pla]|nr:MAG: DNA-binding response regulator [Planctomycetes bacterium B3_Pla]